MNLENNIQNNSGGCFWILNLDIFTFPFAVRKCMFRSLCPTYLQGFQLGNTFCESPQNHRCSSVFIVKCEHFSNFVLGLQLGNTFCESPQNRHCFSVFIVECEHFSNFVLIVDFEQANVCNVHIEKTTTFETRSGISCIMLQQYFKCEQSLLTNSTLTYITTTLRVNK